MGLLRTALAGFSVTAFAGALLVAATAMSYVKDLSGRLPDHMLLDEWTPSRGTAILGRDGSLMGFHATEHRDFVPFEEIPELVKDAFIAAEDGKYWQHSGIDPASIARAGLANFRSGGSRLEGGSTITQQVIKNVILTSEQTFDRKLREAMLAMRADRDLGKERILEIYLNEIYFGAGAYGVASAADIYFDKTLGELEIHEAAMLAGLPKAPSASNPFTSATRARERRSYVLRRMTEEGMIGPDEAAAADAEPLPSAPSGRRTAGDPALWYPQEAVRRTLLSRMGADRLYAQGEDVVTTIDPEFQRAVHASLRRALVEQDRRQGWQGPLSRGHSTSPDWDSEELAPPAGSEDWSVGVVTEAGRDAAIVTRDGRVTVSGDRLAWATSTRRADALLRQGDAVLVTDDGAGHDVVSIPRVQGAIVALDPRTGAVLALAGGFSPQMSEFDRSTQARRQTGSAFKPFVYYAAMEMGYDATSPLLDSPIAIDQGPGRGDWRPQAGTSGMGLMTLRRSLELSRNMSTVRLLHDIGMEAVRDVSERTGIRLPQGASYAAALGATETTPLELAAGYAAFANGGHPVRPTLIIDELEDFTLTPPQLDPVATAQLSSVLEGVAVAGTARRAFEGFPWRIASKTGTTNQSRDAWFVAYNPDIVVAVWIGRDDRSPLPSGSAGGTSAAPAARAVLEAAGSLGFTDFPDFPLPAGTEAVRTDRETGTRSDTGDVFEILRATRR